MYRALLIFIQAFRCISELFILCPIVSWGFPFGLSNFLTTVVIFVIVIIAIIVITIRRRSPICSISLIISYLRNIFLWAKQHNSAKEKNASCVENIANWKC